MGKYDINAKYNYDCKLTIADLCNDILNDVDTMEDKKNPRWRDSKRQI